MRLIAIVMFLDALHGCAYVQDTITQAKCPADYRDDRYQRTGTDITHYVVPSGMTRTPLGVPIGPGVDATKVDTAFTEVAACLGIPFHGCGVHAVMIAPDAFSVPGVEEQVFPCFTPDPNAKLCIGANQWPATIVLTPDMHAIKWEAERMLVKDDPNKHKRCWD